MEVFSFGNGDFLFQIFSAIVGIMGDGSYGTLIRIALVLGFLFLAYQLLFSMNITHVSKGMISHYIFVVVLVGIMFTPKTNVLIRDEVKNTQVVVNNVPYGVGLFAHIFTTVEKGITKLMENYFSTPNDMRFNQSGYAFSVMLLDSFKDAVPKDIYFKQTLDSYIETCFFHDVLWGDKDLQVVIFSNNLWNELSPANSANRYAKVYSQSQPAGEGTICSAAYGHLSGGLGTISADALTTLNSVMQVNVVAKTPAITQYLLGISMSAQDAITQAIASNAVKSSFARTAIHTGSGAGAIPYASGLAEQTQRSSWTVAGDLSKKYIPIMRQVLEAFVYGLFPLLFIMMLTPLGSKYFSLYITLLTWLLLWSPLFAIINLIVNVRANGVLSASYGYFSIGSMPYVYQSASELTAMAGYMAWMVPTIAFAIAKGAETAITSVASGVASSVSFTSKSAASNISSPTAPANIASHAGLLESSQAYGSMAMQGMAASKIFSIQQGMAASGVGMAGTGAVANTEMSGRHMDAKQLDDVAKKYGMTVTQAQGLMASDKYQQALSGAGERKAFAESFAKEHGTTVEAGYQFLAETQMASNRAINDAWGGNVPAYANFLKTGYELSAGQQKGVVQAAKAAGVSVGSYGEMTSFMEEMRKVGALDKFQSGEISSQDLRNMGAMGILSEKGMAEAAQRMSNETGMTVDQAKAHLATREGLNQFAKIEMRDMANRMLGGDSSDKSYYDYVKGVHASDSKTLTAREAETLTKNMRAAGYHNFTANEGDKASFAFNPTKAQFTMAHTSRGGRSETFDVGVVDKGQRQRIGDDIKTGNQIESVDINRSTKDHSSNVKAGHFERTGTDIERVDRDVSTVDRGTNIGGTALQMALRGDPSMYKGVVGAYESNNLAKTSAEVSETSSKIMGGLKSYVEQAGSNSNKALVAAYASLGMGGSAGFLKGEAGVRGQMQTESEGRTTVNLMTKALDDVQTRALKEGERLGYKDKALQSHVAAKTAQFVNTWKSFATSDQEFGAAKPTEMLNQVKDAAKESAAPYPFASSDEMKNRADAAREEIKRKIGGK